METLKQRLQDDMKVSLKSGHKEKLRTIRLILAAVKQREIDERLDLDDAQIVAVLDKMAKQSKESGNQFRAAGRKDLADKEAFEIEIIQGYLPAALSQPEINVLITKTIDQLGASDIRQMGQVMASLKPKVQGRADMADVSASVKQALTSK